MKGPDEPRPRLGRGLAALLGDAGEESAAVARARGQRKVPIEHLRPNPRNPRTHFVEDALDDLANSIREKGIIQPILARTVPGVADRYEIIAGERRWRAAQRAGLHDVPVIAIEADDKQALELAIIENVQRADLNALEEALGYERLAAEFDYTQNDLAKVVGKSRSHVANTLRLLKLPERTKKLVVEGRLSAGHARALLAVKDPDALADRIVGEDLTVREIERLAQRTAEDPAKAARPARKPPREKPVDKLALEKSLAAELGLVVDIRHRGEAGEVRLGYKSLEQLDAIIARLRG